MTACRFCAAGCSCSPIEKGEITLDDFILCFDCVAGWSGSAD